MMRTITLSIRAIGRANSNPRTNPDRMQTIRDTVAKVGRDFFLATVRPPLVPPGDTANNADVQSCTYSRCENLYTNILRG